MANEVLLTNKIFLNAALPLLKVIANDVPSLAKKFEKVHCIYQVSALDPSAPDGKYATHFTVNNKVRCPLSVGSFRIKTAYLIYTMNLLEF